MTEAEALSILEEQLVSPSGFLRALASTGTLDRTGVAQVEQALEELARINARYPDISKAIVRSLVEVTGILHDCAKRFPEISNELWDIGNRIDLLETHLCATERLSESEAGAIVFAQLSGVGSIANTFHYHDPIVNDDWSEELGAAIDTLADAWKERKRVPKAIVRLMLNVDDLIALHADVYPDKRQHLVAVADDLVRRVRRSLT